jgi:hypothetical protein
MIVLIAVDNLRIYRAVTDTSLTDLDEMGEPWRSIGAGDRAPRRLQVRYVARVAGRSEAPVRCGFTASTWLTPIFACSNASADAAM